MSSTISRQRLCLTFLGIALILAILSFVTAAIDESSGDEDAYLLHEAAIVFGVIYEANIPSWYSAGLLFIAACLAGLIAKSNGQFFWGFMAFLLLYMSMDEAAELHELFTVPMRRTLHLGGYLYFAWVVVGLPVALIIALIFIPFWLKIPRHCQISFALGAITYLVGAIFVESLSAVLWEQSRSPTLPYHAISLVEELMEISGVIIVIHSLLWYLETQLGEVRFRIISGNQRREAES